MKFEWDKKYLSIAVYSFLVLVAGILFFSLVLNFSKAMAFLGYLVKILMPFIYGFALAYLINPILHWFEDWLFPKVSKGKMGPKLRRRLGILCAYIVVLVCISVFLRVVIPQVGASLYGIASRIPEFLSTADEWVNSLVASLQSQNFPKEGFEKATELVEQVVLFFYGVLDKVIPYILDTTQKITSGVLNVVLGIIISVYVLTSKERFFAQLKKILSAFLDRDKVERLVKLAHSSHSIFSGFISGKILDSLIIGILCFLGMSLLRMPYAMLISVIVGVTNVIPYFGPFIGAIPSILLILFLDPWKALWFGVFILLLQQFDGNILGPKILGDSTGISAFWVIFSVTLFGGLFGFLGMFLGVPVFAVIYALFRENVEARLKKRQLPIRTQDYSSPEHPIIS